MASGPDPGGRSRFAKLGMAINEVLAQAYRDILEMEVHPNDVFNKVRASPIFSKLQSEQELLLRDAKSSGYTDFDITLLYTLLRNICKKIPPPTQGWGGNTFPAAGDKTVADDIERIRLIRNNVFGHSNSASISQKNFEKNWSLIHDLCCRLQSYCGKNYINGLQNIETQCLEEEHEAAVIEKIKNECEKDKSILELVTSLTKDVKEMKAALDAGRKDKGYRRKCFRINMKAKKPLKQKDVDTYAEMIKDTLNLMIEHIDEKSTDENIYDLLNSFEKYIQGVSCDDRAAVFDLLGKMKKKIHWFANVNPQTRMAILKRFLDFLVELRANYSLDNIQFKSGSILLEITFGAEVGYRKFLDDLKKGIVDQRLISAFVDSDLLSTVGLTRDEISISITYIKNEDVGSHDQAEKEIRPSEAVVSGMLTKGQTPSKNMKAETEDNEKMNERKESEIHKPENELDPEKRKVEKAIADYVPIPTDTTSSVVVAIDFGTTYSGYAFTFPNKFMGDIERKISGIRTPLWNAGNLLCKKTPTVLLLNKDQKFVSFGFEAEDQYGEMTEDERKEYYYFHRFKMMLYDKIGNLKLTRNTILKDVKNKKMLAIDVFAHSIRYFKEHFEANLERDLKHFISHDESIKWILTVPAIWDEPAKQFVKEAAEKAGIPRASLLICLEPAAAAIYCNWLPICNDAMKPGRSFIMLDAGGGTVDMGIQEVQEDGKLLKIGRVQSGDRGGIYVDAEFQQMLEEIVSETNFKEFCTTFTDDYIDLFRIFEQKKKENPPTTSKNISMKVPLSFLEIAGDDINKLITTKGLAESVEWRQHKLYIKLEKFETFFNKVIDKIVVNVKEMLESETAKGTNTILMVGGFSESHFLQQRIKQSFPNCNVVIPPECGLAVLKGAVMFGHDPEMIAAKVARYTYGVASNTPFIEGTHPESKRKILNGKLYCKDRFDIHVGRGELVHYHESIERLYHPIFEDQTEMMLNVFMCNDEYPQYIDESGCMKIGTLTVPMPKTSGGTGRRVRVKICFGRTELIVQAIDENSKKPVKISLDVME